MLDGDRQDHPPPGVCVERPHERLEVRHVVQHVLADGDVGRQDRRRDVRPASVHRGRPHADPGGNLEEHGEQLVGGIHADDRSRPWRERK